MMLVMKRVMLGGWGGLEESEGQRSLRLSHLKGRNSFQGSIPAFFVES